MSALSPKCEIYHSTQNTRCYNIRLQRRAKLVTSILFVAAMLCPALCAQDSNKDLGAPNMSTVTDVTPGWKYLLQNKDLTMVQTTQNSDSTVTTSLVVMDTSKSSLSATPQTITIDNFNPGSTQGAMASQASGRIFNYSTDTVAVLSAIQNGWKVSFADSSGIKSSSSLKSSFSPAGTVYTQVVMGDFNGDGLSDPLAFYTSTNFNGPAEVRWGMVAMTAADPTQPWDFATGPELGGDTTSLNAPVAGTLVVGDFNGDGRDEIAALLNDYQTIAFYSVDPKSLAINKTTTVQLTAEIPTIGNFPITMTSGQVALAAGKFRQCGGNGNPCQANGATNADVVVFGQIAQINGNSSDAGYSVIPIKITPSPGGTPAFIATIVPMKNPTQEQPFFRFPNRSSSNGALAQAAPLVYWPQQTDEQLVLGIKCSGDYAASYIEIGSFLPDDGALDTFDWESETERKYELQSDHLENMWVGNFDHQNQDGSHNAGWQIETYELVGYVNSYDPHINIFNVNVPSPFPPNPSKTTDWLSGQQQSDNTSNVPFANPDTPSLGFLSPSDMQGRSLRLGAPTIVRIPTQTQPDLILAIPPMHVDYITPIDPTLATNNGCANANKPCVVNLSVIPSEPPSQGQGFATSFNFTSSANSSSKRSATTSWGVSTKISVGESATFNDGLENATESVKNTTKAGHDATVKKTYGSYAGTTQSLSATTGLSDYLYFTQKAMNVYYYPVLGCDAAGAKNCWVDNQKVPMYVQFSVPDQVRYSDVDGLKQDWYQPVHEAGNILSYPWSFAQLQNRYTENIKSLTGTATCMATGTSNSSYSTQWTSGHNQDSSSGSTSSFSNELSVSYSEGAGVKGVDAADFNFGMDVAASTSLNTLNESSTSMSTSKAISVHIPQFGYAAKCCDYGFGGYVYGLENKANPASENACTAGQTPDKDGCTAVNDPDTGKPVDIAGTGPMFAGFLADPIPNTDQPNTDLTCSASDAWWQRVYTAPDIALNHPGRWNWSKAQQHVSFVTADSTPIIEDNYFYLMKGFFISKKGNSNGPNLAEARPSDPLTLTARIYNYSLMSTNAPVHVRFYGQFYCTSSGSGENSCKNGNSSCRTPGLCGNSFQIGGDQIIQSIAGFKGNGNEPNWALASVDFEPGKFTAGNAYMVFWVVTWMQDARGELAAEMPGHGLTSVPGSNLTQITQVPIQPYSNNVGMYGVHQHFYVCPASGCEMQQTTGAIGITTAGSLKSITISADTKMLLEQRNKVNATLRATGGDVGPVNIAYYDGDPVKGGTLLDIQQIQHMEAGATYAHRTFFTPETCGTHTLYVSAWTANSPEIQARSSTRVSIDSIDFVKALTDSTATADITDRRLGRNLLDLLNTALQSFRHGQMHVGNTVLSIYIQQLALASGQGISAESARQLTAQASVVLGCGTRGFSLVTSPSWATLSTRNPASYALAVTPIGEFTGKVSLACIGAPKGIGCTFSSQSVVLDGLSQSRVTLTLAAGGNDRENIIRRGSEWQRGRHKPARGIYSFIVQANSGGTIRNTLLSVVIK
jgi:hypothetical protein